MVPKVSIVVPVYNTERYLSKCLDSLIGQTLSDIEIICINDCSTDDSLDVLKSYASGDDRIKIVDFKENEGVSVARNTGIEIAKGEYLGFVDSDDFVEPGFYEKLYCKAIETKADVIKGNVYDYHENGKVELTDFYDINEKIRSNKVNFLYGFTSAIYKTDLIKKYGVHFPEGITHFEDPYFSFSVTLNFGKIETVDDAQYFYVKHKGSTCANSKTLLQTKAFVKSVCLILDLLNSREILKKDYYIYVVFLMQQIVPWCSDLALSDEANMEAVRGFEYILNNTKFSKDELIVAYFLDLKQNKKNVLKRNKAQILEQLRAKMLGNKI